MHTKYWAIFFFTLAFKLSLDLRAIFQVILFRSSENDQRRVMHTIFHEKALAMTSFTNPKNL